MASAVERPTAINAPVLGNRKVARDTYRLRLAAPALAASMLPGQFVMVRPSFGSDPLLARPYALYDTFHDDSGRPAGIDIVYLVMGKGTQALSRLTASDEVALWGPHGKPFPSDFNGAESHLLIVAGGIGQTPFPAVIQWLLRRKNYGSGNAAPASAPRRISFAYGVRNADYFGELDDFKRHPIDMHLATDDGSVGRQGYVTQIAADLLAGPDPPTCIFACGPEPMLHRMALIADAARTPCWVSLETKMACGYGVCFSCVCPIKDGNGFDYQRVCLEGPVFDAKSIEWRAW